MIAVPMSSSPTVSSVPVGTEPPPAAEHPLLSGTVQPGLSRDSGTKLVVPRRVARSAPELSGMLQRTSTVGVAAPAILDGGRICAYCARVSSQSKRGASVQCCHSGAPATAPRAAAGCGTAAGRSSWRCAR